MRAKKGFISALFITMLGVFAISAQAQVPDTGQTYCYGETGGSIPCPTEGEATFGQDGNYITNAQAYVNNGDGTISDLNTGLMWTSNTYGKMTWDDALAMADGLTLAGYDDWRVPSIKELYSLIDFDGITGGDASSSVPYVDTNYFAFEYGNTSAGERFIDAQYWSSTEYVSTTMNNAATVFGVNFADGRIKGYPKVARGADNTMFVYFVRGADYGENAFVDNGDGTISDNSTGLMWTQDDSGGLGASNNGALNWSEALNFCETLTYAGYSDWRLPDAHELQGIVDYTRSPATTNSPALDPIFNATPITDDAGNVDYAFYWSSTTHLDGANLGQAGAYVAFGEAEGYMSFNGGDASLMDVHGAGAQRSDPKTGDPANYEGGRGPQGDVVRIYNYARCVRGGDVTLNIGGATDPRVTGNERIQPDAYTNDTNSQQPPQNNGQQPPNNQNGQGGQPQGQPPQQAIDACNSLAVGNACNVSTPQGALSGTCQTVPNSSSVACVPNS
jgi:hypothetical protein